MQSEYARMDFNYDDDAAAAAPTGPSGEYREHQSPTNGPQQSLEIAPSSGSASSNRVTNLSLPKKKSSILGASSNLVNSIVGAGIIGMPYALRMSGLWAGMLLLVLVAVLTDKSLRLLIEQASFHPKLRNLPVHTFEGERSRSGNDGIGGLRT